MEITIVTDRQRKDQSWATTAAVVEDFQGPGMIRLEKVVEAWVPLEGQSSEQLRNKCPLNVPDAALDVVLKLLVETSIFLPDPPASTDITSSFLR